MSQLLESLSIKHKFVVVEDLTDMQTALQENLSPKLTGVVAVGGNATTNAVINALVGEELPLAIIPMSRTNFLANSLGIHRWDKGIRMLADPDVRSVRLGKVGNQYFINQVEILSHTNLLTRNVRRTSLFKTFLGLDQASGKNEQELHTTVVADEDMTVEGAINRIEAVLNPERESKKLQLTLYTGHAKQVDITKIPANSFTVESDRKMAVVMGNETIGQTPVEIKGLAKYIKILVPRVTPRLTNEKKS